MDAMGNCRFLPHSTYVYMGTLYMREGASLISVGFLKLVLGKLAQYMKKNKLKFTLYTKQTK